MKSDICKKNLEEQMRDILRFRDDHEKLEFEAEMLHLDIMHQVKLLMSEHGMSDETLAGKLNISDEDLDGLFSADILADLKLLAILQRIFRVRFEVITKMPLVYKDEEVEDESRDEDIFVLATA